MLRAVLIDDERPNLDELSFLLSENSVEVIGAFQNIDGALEYIMDKKPEVVFLDIEMRGVNGIDFAVKLQNCSGKINVIFVTAYPEYALESFQAYPLDYIVKPVEEEHLKRTLSRVTEITECNTVEKSYGFYIRCFEKFEIVNGTHKVKLPTKKTRELLAYLLCNVGNKIYRNDLIRLVFESNDNEKGSNNLRVNLFRIRNAFREAGVERNLFTIGDNLSIKISNGVCDLVDFQNFIEKNKVINNENIKEADRLAGLINGELLADIDVLWVIDKREWIMDRVEIFFVNLSEFYLSCGFKEQAESILLKLLSINPSSESAYNCLLELYIQTENALKFRRCYERYCKMVEEFGEKPLKIYTCCYNNFYKMAVQNKKTNRKKG